MTNLFALAVISSCTGEIGSPARTLPASTFETEPSGMRRLTVAQYVNTVRDLLGAALTLSATIEPDTYRNGFTSVGAFEQSISAAGTESFETAALELTQQVFGDAERRSNLTGCSPETSDDCTQVFIERFGRSAFRRPLDVDELNRYSALARTLSERYQDKWQGLRFVVTAMLQSPHFLFIVERGESAPSGAMVGPYTPWEMAARLSYFLWNTTPDEELLDAASVGELSTENGIRVQAERLLNSPRARDGVMRFFEEYLELRELDNLVKDKTLFDKMTPTLGSSMRTEIERTIERIVLQQNADIRELLTTRTTSMNTELAALYGAAPIAQSQGFAEVTFGDSVPRGGILGTAGLLALNAYATRTSPTRRGLFIRTRLLCGEVPPPPPGVVASLPPEDPTQPLSVSERLAQHRSNPACASCHAMMDPIGLGLEQYDPLGEFHPQSAPANADIDGVPFSNARELGEVLRANPTVTACFVRQLYRYARGKIEGPEEDPSFSERIRSFEEAGYRFRELALDLVTDESFRFPGSSPH